MLMYKKKRRLAPRHFMGGVGARHGASQVDGSRNTYLLCRQPIDKVIGRCIRFGVILIIMALSIAGGILLIPGYTIPEVTLKDFNPDHLPVWPFMFITVACGAISGFHATQSPMMAKCITNEHAGRPVFYGAMIIESLIALIWAARGILEAPDAEQCLEELGSRSRL